MSRPGEEREKEPAVTRKRVSIGAVWCIGARPIHMYDYEDGVITGRSQERRRNSSGERKEEGERERKARVYAEKRRVHICALRSRATIQ